MRILFYYQFTEQWKPLLLSIAGISLLFLSGVLFDMSSYLIVRKVPARQVADLLFYKLPSMYVMAAPIAAMFSALFVLGRMDKDGEIIAMRMAGMPCRKIILPYVAVALLVSGVSLGLGELVVPEYNQKAELIVRKIIFNTSSAVMMEDVFFREKDKIFYIGRIDPQSKVLQNVLIYEINDGKVHKVTTAATGSYQESLWSLENGLSHEFDQQGHMVKEVGFSKLQIAVEQYDEKLLGGQRSAQDLTRKELTEQIERCQQIGISASGYEVEYHLRTSLHLSAVLFVLFGAPLLLSLKRKDKMTMAIICVAIALCYYVFSSACAAYGGVRKLPPWVAGWLPDGVFLGLSFVGLWWAERE